MTAMDRLRGGSTQRLAVCLLGLLYTAIQWGGAYKIGPNRIFSRSRDTDRAQFAEMVNSIAALSETCGHAHGDPRSLLFDDYDVVTPYLQIGKPADPETCPMMRDTVVTPYADQEWQACGVVYIHEITPVHPTPWTYPGTRKWSSSNGRFGYQTLSFPSCP